MSIFLHLGRGDPLDWPWLSGLGSDLALKFQDTHNQAADNAAWPDDVRVIPHIFEEHDLLVERSRLPSYSGEIISGLLRFLLDIIQQQQQQELLLLLLLLIILPLLLLRLQGQQQQK